MNVTLRHHIAEGEQLIAGERILVRSGRASWSRATTRLQSRLVAIPRHSAVALSANGVTAVCEGTR